MKSVWRVLLASVVAVTGCAGVSRSCSSSVAESFGADWIVVQYRYDGVPMNGIFWVGTHGHLVHISGWYNRAQVVKGDFESAAAGLGIDLAGCSDGKYIVSSPAASGAHS